MQLVVANEFATVVVEQTFGGSLLHIRDSRTGCALSLDPLELEALTRLTREDLSTFVDPSFRGLAGQREPEETLELVPGEGEA